MGTVRASCRPIFATLNTRITAQWYRFFAWFVQSRRLAWGCTLPENKGSSKRLCYNWAMQSSTHITADQQQSLSCPSCKTVIRFAIIPSTYPHLYCARCTNAYAEPRAARHADRVWWQHLANRQQHHIQSHAPVCECGGLFLFNATPHCPHCRRGLPVNLPTEPKERLRYSNLMIFPNSKLYLDNGTANHYAF